MWTSATYFWSLVFVALLGVYLIDTVATTTIVLVRNRRKKRNTIK